MDIAYNSRNIAEIKLERIRGERRIGAYRLWFHLDVTVRNWPKTEVLVTEICADVHARFHNNRNDYLVAPATPERPMFLRTLDDTSHKSNFGLYVDLDRVCLEEIESLRDGNDFWLRLHFKGIANGPNGRLPLDAWLAPEFDANQSVWLKVLAEMGYQRSMLFEIVIPNPDGSDELSRSTLYLIQAQEDLVRGRYEDAISDCRKALESLAGAMRDQSELEKSIKRYCRINESDQVANSLDNGDSRRSMTMEERFLFLRAAIQHITNLAHHASEPGRLPQRADAKCIIAATAAVISRFRTINL